MTGDADQDQPRPDDEHPVPDDESAPGAEGGDDARDADTGEPALPPPPPPPPPGADSFPSMEAIAREAEEQFALDAGESDDARMSDAALPSFPARDRRSADDKDEDGDPFGRLASDRFRSIESDRADDHFAASPPAVPEAMPAGPTDGADADQPLPAVPLDPGVPGAPLEEGASGPAPSASQEPAALFAEGDELGPSASGETPEESDAGQAEREQAEREASVPKERRRAEQPDDEPYFDPFSDDEFEYHPEHLEVRGDDEPESEDPGPPSDADSSADAESASAESAPSPAPAEPSVHDEETVTQPPGLAAGAAPPPPPGVDPAIWAAASAETLDAGEEVVPNLEELRARYRELTRAREEEPGDAAPGGETAAPTDETAALDQPASPSSPRPSPPAEIADSTLASEVQGLEELRAQFRQQTPDADEARSVPPTMPSPPPMSDAPVAAGTPESAPPKGPADTGIRRAAERGADLLGELHGRYRSTKFPTRAVDLAEQRMTLRVKEDQEQSELPTLPEIREMTAPDEIHQTIRFRSTREEPVEVPPHLRGAPPLIQVRDLKLAYGDTVVLDDIEFDVFPGEIFVILGGSGCGKSTLLKHMIHLYPAAGGSVEIDGEDIVTADGEQLNGILRKIGVMYQLGALFGSMTLLENVRLPLEEFTRLPTEAMNLIARMKLSLVGLEPYRNYYPAEISGGMQKRAAIARAMALDPRILFLDEPGAGLDPVTSAELDDLIVTLARNLGITFVIVTHELASIFAIADRAIMLDKRTRGIIAEGNPRQLRDESTDPRVRQFFHREIPSTGAGTGEAEAGSASGPATAGTTEKGSQ